MSRLWRAESLRYRAELGERWEELRSSLEQQHEVFFLPLIRFLRTLQSKKNSLSKADLVLEMKRNMDKLLDCQTQRLNAETVESDGLGSGCRPLFESVRFDETPPQERLTFPDPRWEDKLQDALVMDNLFSSTWNNSLKPLFEDLLSSGNGEGPSDELRSYKDSVEELRQQIKVACTQHFPSHLRRIKLITDHYLTKT